jgi:hypothetical protein
MTHIERKIEHVKAWPQKIGKADYLKYLNGETLTQRQAIKAKCYECCCGEPAGCSVKFCSLLPIHRLIHGKESSETSSTSPDSD